MIIELDISLVARLEQDASFESFVCVALDNIANAQREGNHLVFAELSTLEALRKYNGWFSPRTNAVLQRAANRFPQLTRFARSVCVKLLVGDFNAQSVEMREGCRTILFPVESVTTSLVQRTLLLVENVTDATYYQWITEHVLAGGEFRDCHMSLEAYQGGGNTTGEAYEHIKHNTSRLCLCIVDSDIRSPEAAHGDTAAKVWRSDHRRPSPRTDHHVLDVCSIENLIPFEVFESAWASDPNLRSRLDEYRPLYVDERWPYLQLKKDVKCIELQSEKAFSVFWHPVLATEATRAACENDEREAKCTRRDDCDVIALRSLASSPLNAALSTLNDNASRGPFKLLPRVAAAWSEIARLIIGWCCATPPVAAG
ncbi:hypothetical protein FX016_13305 [Cupriavidus gilardii]|nr:hypothetical protein FX016_13305 [Cupriavidus gilardii]